MKVHEEKEREEAMDRAVEGEESSFQDKGSRRADEDDGDDGDFVIGKKTRGKGRSGGGAGSRRK